MKNITKLLLLGGVIVFATFSCEKEETPKLSDFMEGYITGSFICDETGGKEGQATGKKTERAYCILLDSSENTDSHWPMDFYTFNLPSDFFDYPTEILSNTHDGSNCGPVFFPDSMKNEYKISFKYKKPEKSERIYFACGFCSMMALTFPWKDYDQVTLINITKMDQ